MPAQEYEHFKEICQGRGFRATSQRFVIFKALLDSQQHPTAEQLFDSVALILPSLSRDTVYRTVNLLTERGLVKKLAIVGEATRYDGNLSPHHHFICEVCGVAYDIPWLEFDALPWPEVAFEVGTPQEVTLCIYGLGVCCKGLFKD